MQPITLILSDETAAWHGDVSGRTCFVTGASSYCFDTYQDHEGHDVLVSANASQKIKDFVRARDSFPNEAPLEFVVYGVPVTIIDKRG